jgi:hypothetical protein
MRVLKVLVVSVSIAASMVVGVSATADAAPAKVTPHGTWCC